jgi:hypothetical protein
VSRSKNASLYARPNEQTGQVSTCSLLSEELAEAVLRLAIYEAAQLDQLSDRVQRFHCRHMMPRS